MARYYQVKSAQELIQRYFSDYLAGPTEGDKEEEVRLVSKADWRKVVGERVAQHATPLYVERGVLIIEADHSAWSHFILLRSAEIISELNGMDVNLSIHFVKLKLTRPNRN